MPIGMKASCIGVSLLCNREAAWRFSMSSGFTLGVNWTSDQTEFVLMSCSAGLFVSTVPFVCSQLVDRITFVAWLKHENLHAHLIAWTPTPSFLTFFYFFTVYCFSFFFWKKITFLIFFKKKKIDLLLLSFFIVLLLLLRKKMSLFETFYLFQFFHFSKKL